MHCPNCHAEAISQLHSYKGSHPVFQKMFLEHCNQCDLVFAAPQPTMTELGQYYSCYWDGSAAISTAATRRYYLAQSISRVRYLSNVLTSGKAIDVLDVGAGVGLFDDALQFCGVSRNYMAVEPDNDQYEKLSSKFGRQNVAKDISEIPADRSFDLIVLSHVLEHMTDPHEFIGIVLQFLRADGVLFIEVPNEDYLYKTNFEPHLLFFNEISLSATLSNHGTVYNISSVGKERKNLQIANDKPSKGLLAFVKQLIKSVLVLVTPNIIENQIKNFELSSYGRDRQWLRAIVRKTV